MVYIAIDGIDDASGIKSNYIVLKTPIEATEDACSALKHDHTSVNSYKAAQLYFASSSVSVMNGYVEKCPRREDNIRVIQLKVLVT